MHYMKSKHVSVKYCCDKCDYSSNTSDDQMKHKKGKHIGDK